MDGKRHRCGVFDLPVIVWSGAVGIYLRSLLRSSRVDAQWDRYRARWRHANRLLCISINIVIRYPNVIVLSPWSYGEGGQQKWRVNLAMWFFKCKQCIIVNKINMSIKGFCSLLHYVNCVVVELIFLQLFTSAIMGNVSITIYIINLCSSKTITDNLSLKPFLLITTLILNLIIEWR